MTRTELTAEQYSELVCALEAMHANGYDYPMASGLSLLLNEGRCTPFAFVYLVQWFHIVGWQHSHIQHMVAELCEERTNAPRL